jgi:hypothetical protein
MINYGVKDCAKLAFYKKSDNSLFAYFPFGNSMNIGITGDKVEALANGTTIITWQANRKGTVQIDTQVISPKLLAIVLGATNSTEASGTIAQFETGKIGTSAPTFTLAETPSTATLSVFLTESDGATVKSELTAIGSAPTAAQYSISGKVITVHADNAGKNILCIYAKDGTNIDKTVIKSNEFAQAFKIVGLGTVKGVDGVEHLQEINIPNATAQSNADFTYSSTDASNFSFTFDLAQDPVTNEMVSFKTL